jgi:hypothetical protein
VQGGRVDVWLLSAAERGNGRRLERILRRTDLGLGRHRPARTSPFQPCPSEDRRRALCAVPATGLGAHVADGSGSAPRLPGRVGRRRTGGEWGPNPFPFTDGPRSDRAIPPRDMVDSVLGGEKRAGWLARESPAGFAAAAILTDYRNIIQNSPPPRRRYAAEPAAGLSHRRALCERSPC